MKNTNIDFNSRYAKYHEKMDGFLTNEITEELHLLFKG